MAQPNVAREPSMEEILASIRKIIESNEPGAGKSLSAALPPVYAQDESDEDEIHLTVDNDNSFMADFDEEVREARTERPSFADAPARASEDVRSTLSLADVAARVRAASERNAAAPQREPEVRRAEPEARRAEPEPAAPVAPARAVELRSAPPAVSVPSIALVRSSPIAPAPAVMAPMPDVFDDQEAQADLARDFAAIDFDDTVELAQQTSDVQDEPDLDLDLDEPAVDAPREPLAALTSKLVGDQVARAFADLEIVRDGSPRRSLDDVAGEMLRPMLQDWLDDNLPTLVERLVREEIERVARGPRR